MSDGDARVLRLKLDAAVAAGVIDQTVPERLLPFLLMAEPSGSEDPDDERLRLITGFNDIFVTIGLGMFLGALAYLTYGMGIGLSGLVIAAAAWALAEFFTRLRRMALPSIALLLVFASSAFVAALAAMTSDPILSTGTFFDEHPLQLVVAGATTALAAWLHWLRFHVPITVAAGVSALAVIVLAVVTQLAPGLLVNHPIPVFATLGFAIFVLAMRFDMSDRMRQTRRTDIAFWLHLLAAPIIVHPILLHVSAGGAGETGQALLVVAVFLMLGIVALVVDRRALLVSSLTYLSYAAGKLIAAAGLDSSSFAVSTLTVGAVVLMLSAAWKPLRLAVVSRLPDNVRQRVPVAG